MALDFLKKLFGNGHLYGGDILVPADQFRTLVLRECARCNRNAHAFSLIHIDLRTAGNGCGQDRKRTLRELTRALVRRIRTTDEIGWLDDHSIGVFLPETEQAGASSLARDVCGGITYQIYTYPWLGAFGDDDDRPSRPEGDQFGGEAPDRRAAPDSRGQMTIHHSGVRAGKPASAGTLEELLLPARPPLWKRAYDIFGSSVLLIAFAPLFAMVALYIKAVSPGPVFFRQERMGYLGRPFTLIKFRTMRTDSDTVSVHKDYLKDLIKSDGKAMTKLDTGKDDRLIPLAGILRRTCIDELPQLINVFKGEMSLVGPRPCLDYEAREFDLWQHRRFHTVPGMTGLWQVSGKNRLTFKEMMRLDIRYADRRNAALDMAISLKTVPAILGQVGDVVRRRLHRSPGKPSGGRNVRRWSLNHLIRQLFL